MPCPICVAADLSGIKTNLSFAFPQRPRVADVVPAAELAFSNYARHALGLPATRPRFRAVAVVIHDPCAACWELIDEREYESTLLSPGMQLYLFQPNVTEVQGEVPDPVDAQLFLTTFSSPLYSSHSQSPQTIQPSLRPLTQQIDPVMASRRVSRGTGTDTDDAPFKNQAQRHGQLLDCWPSQHAADAACQTETAPLVSVATAVAPRGDLMEADRLQSRTAQTRRRSPPNNTILSARRPSTNRARQPWAASVSPTHLRSQDNSYPRSPAYSRPSSVSPYSSTTSRAPLRDVEVPRRWLRQATPTPVRPRALTPENRGKSILREEQDRMAHFDHVSLDHLRADLRREESAFDVSIGSRSQSQQSHR